MRKRERTCELLLLPTAHILSLSVNLATMSNVEKVDLLFRSIKIIEHAVVTDTQAAFASAFQTMMWKRIQPNTHFIDLILNLPLDRWRESIEVSAKCVGPDLE